jgi:hypothetical protein
MTSLYQNSFPPYLTTSIIQFISCTIWLLIPIFIIINISNVLGSSEKQDITIIVTIFQSIGISCILVLLWNIRFVLVGHVNTSDISRSFLVRNILLGLPLVHVLVIIVIHGLTNIGCWWLIHPSINAKTTVGLALVSIQISLFLVFTRLERYKLMRIRGVSRFQHIITGVSDISTQLRVLIIVAIAFTIVEILPNEILMMAMISDENYKSLREADLFIILCSTIVMELSHIVCTSISREIRDEDDWFIGLWSPWKEHGSLYEAFGTMGFLSSSTLANLRGNNNSTTMSSSSLLPPTSSTLTTTTTTSSSSHSSSLMLIGLTSPLVSVERAKKDLISWWSSKLSTSTLQRSNSDPLVVLSDIRFEAVTQAIYAAEARDEGSSFARKGNTIQNRLLFHLLFGMDKIPNAMEQAFRLRAFYRLASRNGWSGVIDLSLNSNKNIGFGTSMEDYYKTIQVCLDIIDAQALTCLVYTKNRQINPEPPVHPTTGLVDMDAYVITPSPHASEEEKRQAQFLAQEKNYKNRNRAWLGTDWWKRHVYGWLWKFDPVQEERYVNEIKQKLKVKQIIPPPNSLFYRDAEQGLFGEIELVTCASEALSILCSNRGKPKFPTVDLIPVVTHSLTRLYRAVVEVENTLKWVPKPRSSSSSGWMIVSSSSSLFGSQAHHPNSNNGNSTSASRGSLVYHMLILLERDLDRIKGSM